MANCKALVIGNILLRNCNCIKNFIVEGSNNVIAFNSNSKGTTAICKIFVNPVRPSSLSKKISFKSRMTSTAIFKASITNALTSVAAAVSFC